MKIRTYEFLYITIIIILIYTFFFFFKCSMHEPITSNSCATHKPMTSNSLFTSTETTALYSTSSNQRKPQIKRKRLLVFNLFSA